MFSIAKYFILLPIACERNLGEGVHIEARRNFAQKDVSDDIKSIISKTANSI